MAGDPTQTSRRRHRALAHPLTSHADSREPVPRHRQAKVSTYRLRGEPVSGRLRGPLERQPRLRPPRDRAGRLRPDGRASLLLRLRRILQRAGHPAGREALDPHAAGTERRLLHLGRIGGQRERLQDRPLLLEAGRQARQGEVHLPALGLSRREAGRAQRHGVPLFRDLYGPLSPPSSRSRHPTATGASSAGTSPPATSAARTIWRSPSSGTARTPSPASSPSRDGTGGVIPPASDDYLPRVREICRKHDILYITTRSSQASAAPARPGRGQLGVVPDIKTMAKGLTSAYLPLGAAVVSDRIHGAMQEIRSGVSSPTASPIPGTRAAAPPA